MRTLFFNQKNLYNLHRQEITKKKTRDHKINCYFKDCNKMTRTVMLPVVGVFLCNCVMSDEVLLMENTSASDLVEELHFDIRTQYFGSLGAFCVRNEMCQAACWYRQQCLKVLKRWLHY